MKKQVMFAAGLLAGTLCMAQGVSTPADPAPMAATNQSGPPLTLKRAFELAAKRSERLDIRAESIEQSKARYNETRGGVLPNLKFNVSETLQDTSGTGTGGSGVQSTLTQGERTESKFMLRQPLFQGFKEFAALKALKADENQQRLLFQREATLLYQDVALAFFTVIEKETELSDLQALMNLSKSRIDDLRQRTNLGKSRNSEVVTAESQFADYKAQEAALRGDVAVARESLSFLVGEPIGSTPIVDSLPDPTAVPDVSDLVTRSRDRSDVAALKQVVEGRSAGIRVARAGYYPSLVASGDYYLKRPGFQKDIKWDALFSLDVPIYQGGSVKAFNLEARSLLRQAQKDYERLARQTESDVRKSHASLSSSIEQTRLLDDAAKKARRGYELLDKEYRMGLSTNLDVLQAMNTFETVKRDFDLARAQSKLDLLNLRLAVEMAPEELP